MLPPSGEEQTHVDKNTTKAENNQEKTKNPCGYPCGYVPLCHMKGRNREGQISRREMKGRKRTGAGSQWGVGEKLRKQGGEMRGMVIASGDWD